MILTVSVPNNSVKTHEENTDRTARRNRWIDYHSWSFQHPFIRNWQIQQPENQYYVVKMNSTINQTGSNWHLSMTSLNNNRIHIFLKLTQNVHQDRTYSFFFPLTTHSKISSVIFNHNNKQGGIKKNFLYSRFLLLIYFIHISVYMDRPYSWQ